MAIFDKVQRFIGKSPDERVRALGATLRSVLPDGLKQDGSRQILRRLTGGMAVPKVLHSTRPLYVAYRPDADREFDRYPELRALADKWVANNVANNAGDLPRLYALLLNIRQVMQSGVGGDFAELGVYRGNSAAVLAHFSAAHGRSLYLFDTFEGFDAKDFVGIDADRSTAFADTSLELVRQTVGDPRATYVQGFFPGTVTPEIAARRFAVVHLDCDLYEPMRAGLEFFFPRLSPGGLMIMHDYANPHWEGARRAIDEFLPGISENLVVIPDKSGTAMIRKSR